MATKGYQSYRGRGGLLRGLAAAVLILILLGACAFMLALRYVTYTDDGGMRLDLPFLEQGIELNLPVLFRPASQPDPQEPAVGDGEADLNLVVESAGGEDPAAEPESVPEPEVAERRLISLDQLPETSEALAEQVRAAGASGFVWTARGRNGGVNYALEGSIFVAGAAIQWLRDELKLVDSAADTEYHAGKVRDTNGCYVVPAFTGLGAPHWDQYARGVIVGLTRGVNKNHIIRATLESIAYQVRDVLEAMRRDSGLSLPALRVDGGASANNLLMQLQADIIDAPVHRPACVETTALGAAYLAGLAVGYWESKEDVVRNCSMERTFLPAIGEAERQEKLIGWEQAVKRAFGWAN